MPRAVALLVGNNHAVSSRIKAVLLTERSKQRHRRLIGALYLSLGLGFVGAGKAGAAGVADAVRLRHLHANVGVVCIAASVPAPVIPWQALVHGSIRLQHPMDGHLLARPVPAIGKHLCAGLAAPYTVEHQALWPTPLEGGVAAVRLVDVVLVAVVIDAVILDDVHTYLQIIIFARSCAWASFCMIFYCKMS